MASAHSSKQAGSTERGQQNPRPLHPSDPPSPTARNARQRKVTHPTRDRGDHLRLGIYGAGIDPRTGTLALVDRAHVRGGGGGV